MTEKFMQQPEEVVLKKVMQYSLDMICIVDLDGNFLEVSDACYPILGYHKQEMIGRNWREFISIGDRDRITDIVQNTKDTFGTIQGESEFIHKNGKIVPLMWSVAISEEENTAFCIGRDITQLKEDQKKERKKDEFYKALVEYSTDMVVVLDASGKYIFVGKTLTKVLGYRRKELLGTPALDLVHPDDQAKFRALWSNFSKRKKQISSYRYRAANGEWQWLESVFSNKLDNPAVNGIVVNARDITKRKESELKFLENRERYKALFRLNPDAIIFENPEGLITDVNDVFLNYVCCSKEELLHQPLALQLTPDKINVYNQYLKQALNGSVVRFDMELQCRDGSLVFLDINKFPVYVKNQILGVFTIAKDITPIIRSYNTIKQQAAKLNTIFESITDAFIMLDKNWVINTVNKEYCRIVNLHPDQLIGHNVWELFPEEVGGEFYEKYHFAIETGQSVHFEGFFKGSGMWLNIKAFPSDEGLSIYMEDITRQKQTDLQEILGKKVLELMARPKTNLQDIVGFYLEGLEKIYPDMITAVLRLDEEKLYYEAAPRLPESYKSETNGISIGPNVCSCGTAVYLKKKIITSSIATDPRWQKYKQLALENNLRACWCLPIIGSNNEVLGTFATFYQTEKEPTAIEEQAIEKARNLMLLIFEKALTEQALINSNERYKLATAATQDLIWDWNLLTQEIVWGENAAKFFGIDPGSITLDYWYTRVLPEDQVRVMDSLNQAIADPEASFWYQDYKMLNGNQEVIFIKEHGYIVRDHSKRAVRMVGAMHDVTERQKNEAEKERMILELQHRNTSLQQFTHIVSHNLRSSVAKLLGLTTIFKMPGIDEAMKDDVIKGIQDSAQNLDTVIKDLNQILSMRGNLDQILERVRFEDELALVLHLVKEEAERNNIRFETDFSEAAEVLTVRSYLNSILYNLISNALKYRHPDRQTIIQVRTFLENGFIVLEVKDNGLGFNLEQQKDKIFGLYKRFHPDIEGKGIGLFLVKTQIEMLGGKVDVSSKVQEGTSFRVYFRNKN